MVSIKSPAKINLYLRVVGRRADGFHELDTLFQEIDLHDELHWQPDCAEAVLEVEGPAAVQMPATEDNLVMRAIRLYDNMAGTQTGGTFRLVKHIPSGGGLGGGSSNAAAALTLINRHHSQPLSNQRLAECALQLGSDVPFFLQGGTRHGKGRGEILTNVALPDVPRRGFLLLPGIAISTADVFRSHARRENKEMLLSPNCDVGRNDLLLDALSVSKPFANFWAALESRLQGQIYFMSGSGSTTVWLTENPQMPGELAAEFRDLDVGMVPFRFIADSFQC